MDKEPLSTKVKVSSGHLDWVDHSDKTLHVKFKNGDIYHYPDAYGKHFQSIATSKTPGKYFTDNVRNLKFTKEKVSKDGTN